MIFFCSKFKVIYRIIPLKYTEKCKIEVLMNMNFEKEKLLPIKLPSFYAELIVSWHLCGGGLKAPQKDIDIRQELIWGNKHIQTKGKTLYYAHWSECNINFTDDLLDHEGKFKPGQEIFLKLKTEPIG